MGAPPSARCGLSSSTAPHQPAIAARARLPQSSVKPEASLPSGANKAGQDSARVGLLHGCSLLEGVELHAGGVNRRNQGPARHIDFEAAGAFDLGHQVDIGQTRAAAETKIASAFVSRQQRLESIKASADPGGAPGIDGRLVSLNC